MQIYKIKIKNFRNLNDVEMSLHPYVNFLVGENNLGKSNFLDMLNIIFNRRKFEEADFFNKENPIEILITLRLDDIEKGIFEDLFDPQNSDFINISIKQEALDDYIRYFHKESGQEIHYTNFQCANFIKYDSLRSPKEELTFYRGRGVGKFLKYLVEKFLEDAEQYIPGVEGFVERGQIQQIIDFINGKLKKLKTFKEFGIIVSIEEEIGDLIYRLLSMKDSKGLDIQKIGYGVQFMILIVLSIMEKMMHLLKSRRHQGCIFNQKDSSKYISLILGLDEPEIHLHPHMQRSLVKYLKKILSNENAEFSNLLKELFDIDKIIGQAIIVTHSPNVLLNDYKQIIRFYSSRSSIKVKSGGTIELRDKERKQLSRNLPFIKEAFFSKCVIVVEGDTELGALYKWGEKVLGDIDDYGITIIKAEGKGSIRPLVELLNNFDIKTVSIVDRDDGKDVDGYDFVTEGRDFEEEIANELFSKNKKKAFEILVELGIFEPKQEEYVLDKLNQEKFAEKLRRNKGISTGILIGEKVDRDLIPSKFKQALEKAKKYVQETQ